MSDLLFSDVLNEMFKTKHMRFRPRMHSWLIYVE
jgi:hypothetical protein